MPDLSPLTEDSIEIPAGLPALDGKLSRAARVLLAMDVRARLTAAKPDVRLQMTSVYFACAREAELRSGAFDSSKIPTKVCQVCARGALFLASVDRYNECEVEIDYPSAASDEISDLVTTRSREEFGEDQTYEIESAFENGRFGFSGKKTMLAICENLIANHGELISDQHYGFLSPKKKTARAASMEANPA